MSSEPARLVLVVGPSGAGKDTLIAGAAAALAGDARFAFPRRVVTRVADAAEDHDTMNRDAFASALARGAFALHWQAHGLDYGIPADGLGSGEIIVCNVSRAIIPEALRRFPRTSVVYVTAPPDLRAARLAGRGREAGNTGEINARLVREVGGDNPAAADLVIDNCASVAAGTARLVAFLRGV